MAAATDMTVPEAARVLGCSAPTVRKLVADGQLPALATKRGKRTFLTIRSTNVHAYVKEHGTFAKRARRQLVGDDQYQSLVAEIRALRELVGTRGSGGSRSTEALAEAVGLREALHLQRAAMAALQEADDARSEGVKHLQRAMQSFEDADAKRKRATSLLDEVIGSLTVPGSVEGLSD